MGLNLTTGELEGKLGSQLRDVRLRRNLSQLAIASAAGVALGSLRSLESGSGATVATLVRVVQALDLLDWLSSLQPEVTISPMQMIKAKQPRQRARRTEEPVNGDKL
ncbi:helix-turn-helix domain-containing protein [Rhodoferax sp.]|uniref:helix-turn-helix domain-containing protein n=1 Tax=Rhodoferax sp. TaxID=50421 RepID=UPI0039B93598